MNGGVIVTLTLPDLSLAGLDYGTAALSTDVTVSAEMPISGTKHLAALTPSV